MALVVLSVVEQRLDAVRAVLDGADGHCCVASSLGQRRHDPDVRLGSNAEREVVECHSELVTGGDFGGELVVAAAQILHEGMTGG